MNIEVYKKANKIYAELKECRKLRKICADAATYKKLFLTKKFLWFSEFNESEIVLCDKELINLIREYCDRKINRLERQLEAL